MIKSFKQDNIEATKGEHMVRLVFEDIYDGKNLKFEEVGHNPKYYHRGDIRITDEDGAFVGMIEVKTDGECFNTGNVLAEHEVTFYGTNTRQKGFMQKANYSVVAYHSKELQRIWLIDFKAWKEYYQSGRYIDIPHPEQMTHGYLNPIWVLKKRGIITYVIDYDFSGSYDAPTAAWCISRTKVEADVA